MRHTLRILASILMTAASGAVAVAQAPAQTPPAAVQAQAPPAAPAATQRPAEARSGLEVKYVRDSAEYSALMRQIYRGAAREVLDAAARGSGPWAVVLDVDETALDNSVYQLERYAYGLPYDDASWDAWVWRTEARAVPGVEAFVQAVRRAGGRVAWITNRSEATREATRRNLVAQGLWSEEDRLCLQTGDGAYTKAARRREARTGSGACAWVATPTRLLAFVGDQMGDFPAAGEADIEGAGDDELFGRRFFVLPGPMYGRWVGRVTREPAGGRR